MLLLKEKLEQTQPGNPCRILTRVPLSKLTLKSAFNHPTWVGDLSRPITKGEVRREIRLGNLLGHEASAKAFCGAKTIHRVDHARRIAFLVVQGWTDPIEINIEKSGWIIADGNHRLAAAFYRGYSDIEARILDYTEI
jgi:hypothetical protein